MHHNVFIGTFAPPTPSRVETRSNIVGSPYIVAKRDRHCLRLFFITMLAGVVSAPHVQQYVPYSVFEYNFVPPFPTHLESRWNVVEATVVVVGNIAKVAKWHEGENCF